MSVRTSQNGVGHPTQVFAKAHQSNHLVHGDARIRNDGYGNTQNQQRQDFGGNRQNSSVRPGVDQFGAQTHASNEGLSRAKTSQPTLSRYDSSVQNLDIRQNENYSANARYVDTKGLVEFLRSEYYRRFGVYVNKSRDELKFLISFWHSGVSIEEKKKLENQLHKQSLMNAELTFQRPAIKPAFDSKDSQSKSELETKYDNYGSLSAEIVGKTVQDFLNDEMNREREEQRRMEDKKHNQDKEKIKSDKDKVKLMLHWFYIWAPAITEEWRLIEDERKQWKDNKLQIKKLENEDKDASALKKKQTVLAQNVGKKMQKWQDKQHDQDEVHQPSYLNNLCYDAQLNKTIVKHVRREVRYKMPEDNVVVSNNDYQAMRLVMNKYIDLCWENKQVSWMDSLSIGVMTDIYKDFGRKSNDMPNENSFKTLMHNFLSKDQFIRRVQIHKRYIKSATAKVNLKLTDSLYFEQLSQRDKWVNMLNLKADDFFKQIHEQSMKEDELRKKQEQDDKANQDKIKKAKHYDPAILEKLAKSKDKWAKGRVLQDLARQFPHDRVLERMVQAEFNTNQTFRYPQEYDVLNKDKDIKLKKFFVPDQQIKDARSALANATQLRDEKGLQMIEQFKQNDQSERAGLNRHLKNELNVKNQFEKSLIDEAQNYLQEVKSRLAGQKKTLRKSLGIIYCKLRVKFFKYVVKNYPMLSDKIHPGQKIEDEKRVRQNLEHALNDMEKKEQKKLESEKKKHNRSKSGFQSENEDEPVVKDFPDRFKRHFFRVVKALIDDKPGLSYYQKMKRIRQLAPAFFIRGGVSRTTFNKKIMVTIQTAKKIDKNPLTLRQRVFYRQDYKDKLAKVFMTQEELQNCTFEPKVAALKYINVPHQPQHSDKKNVVESCANTYAEQHKDNFKQSHPEIYKSGKMKQANKQYKEGDYEKAMSTLESCFKIYSLRLKFEPGFKQKEAAEFKRKQHDNKVVGDVSKGVMNMLNRNKSAQDEEKKLKKTADISSIHHLKEHVDDKQKNMAMEDFENKRLLPILQEAFDLWFKLDNIHRQNKKKAKMAGEQHKELAPLKNNLKNDAPDDESTKGHRAFKTIMCPLGQDCSHSKKNRPKSKPKQESEVKQTYKCPYAHHLMELEFPETMMTKINSLKQTQKNLDGHQNVKHGIHKTCFYPADRGEIRKGLGKKVDDEVTLEKKKQNLYNRLKSRDQDFYSHLKEIHHLQEQMNKVKGQGGDSNRSGESSNKSQVNSSNDNNSQGGKRPREFNKTVDFNYSKKFGFLKKAALFFNAGDLNEAWDQILDAIRIVKSQKQIENEIQQKIEARWKTKLDLEDFDFEETSIKPALSTPADDTVFWNNFYSKNQILNDNPEKKAAVKMYISQVSPWFNKAEYNKNEFLNGCIEELFRKIEHEHKRKSKFYELLKSVQSKEDKDDEGEDLDLNIDNTEKRKSRYSVYRKGEKENEEKQEVILWEFDLLYPYKKHRARTPQLCKHWYPERDKTFDEEGHKKIAESKRKRLDTISNLAQKRKEDGKIKLKEHLRTCKSAHYLYQLGDIQPEKAEGQEEQRAKAIKPWETFDKDPEHVAWEPAGRQSPIKDASLFAPYRRPKSKSKKGESNNNEEDLGNDDIFNPARQTDVAKPKPKEQATDKK